MADSVNVDTQIDTLHTSIAKLQKDLKTWQVWDYEYEELKEELDSLSDDASAERLASICESFDGQYVDTKTIKEVLGLDGSSPRTPSKAIRILSQCQEYVQRNISDISKQLATAEFALVNVASATESVPHDISEEPRSADRLPIFEIEEELDEQDHVIASHVFKPEDAEKQVRDMLNKAGVSMAALKSKTEEAITSTSTDMEASQDKPDRNEPAPIAEAARDGADTDSQPKRPSTIRKKSVSFAEDTKPPSEPPSRPSSVASSRSDQKSVTFSDIVEEFPADENEAIDGQSDDLRAKLRDLSSTFSPGSKVIELDDDDNALGDVVIPEDETPEEAQLRRQMLAYNLNEVGSVVAQLDLEEGYSDDDENDEESSQFDYTDATSLSDLDDDDEHGRTRTRVITDEYRQRMLELEKRLDARMIANVGPNMPTDAEIEELDDDPGPEPRDAHRIVIRDRSAGSDPSESDTGSKKSVRFAETIDVHHMDSKPQSKSTKSTVKNPPAVMSNIVESNEFSGRVAPVTEKKKQSRFKTGRQAGQPEARAPVEEARPILTENVMERTTPSEGPSAPKLENDDDADDDPEIRRRQLASEYYRLRNSIIRNQEGGFKESPEEAYEPLMEEKDGKVRKVSRFRAARVGGYKPDDE